ncbi:MAG: restriction endonuclease subunit S [Chitinophagales bacterium]
MVENIKNEIPTSWIIRKLSDVATIIMGQAPDGKSYNSSENGVPFIAGAGDLGELYPTTKRWTTSPTSLSKKNDIIFCIRATIGELNFSDKEYCLGRGVAGIRANENLVDTFFLYYWLKLNKERFINKGTGTTFLQIRKKDLANSLVYIPTLPEQKAIVKILQQAERLKELRKLADKKIKQLKSDLFYDIFLRDQGALNSWGKIPLEKMTTKITSGSRGWSKYYSDQGARFIRVQDISNGEINSDNPQMITPPDTAAKERSLIFANDILISIVGSTGKIALFSDDIGEAYVSQNVAIIRLNEGYSPLYVSSYLRHPMGGMRDIIKLSYGQTQPTIGLNHLAKIRIPVPPKDLIDKLNLIYEQYFLLRNAAIFSNKRLETLNDSLKIQAFTGKLTQGFRQKEQFSITTHAKLRDETLQLKSTSKSILQTDESTDLLLITINYLSEDQQEILDSIKGTEGYILAENDFNDLDLPPNQVQRNLDLLAEIGLIKSVNIPVAPGEIGHVFYTAAYRSLKEEDDTKLADMDNLEKETII